MRTYKYAFFEPHVGLKYGTQESVFKKSILVLGDSHYCEEDCDTCGDKDKHHDCAGFTTVVVKKFLKHGMSEAWMKTYTTFINSLLRRRASISDRESFFESVAFYNFLQRAAGSNSSSANMHAGEYDSTANWRAFHEVLEQLMPEIVISWGDRVWEALPNDWGCGEAKKGEGIKIGAEVFYRYYDYPFKDSRILLVGVHHPCVGYSIDFHSAVFNALGVN